MPFFKDPIKRRKFFKFLFWSIATKVLTAFLMYLIWNDKPTAYDFVGSIVVIMIIMYSIDSLRVEHIKAKR